MSKWDDFKKTLGNFADKTVTKTRELTDTASLKIKIANKEADRDIEYKRLGKLTYAKLKKLEGHSTEELTVKISESIEKLDNIIAELNALKSEDEERKAAKEAEKAAKAAARNDDDEELNTDTINGFEAKKSEENSDTASV
ncbi:MAG: hypothetical protein E7592_01470 [Ruminococcaceae bacterium]|nr:hypothetical protein [Oscillospiraceae bacterium]